MKTYVVIKPISEAQYLMGHFRPIISENTVIKALGKINGQPYGVYSSHGESIRHLAEKSAQKINGIIVPVESDYWPGAKEVLLSFADNGSRITF